VEPPTPPNTQTQQEPTDAQLVEQCRKELPHTLHAYRELLVRYERIVFGTCMKMLGNPEDAEEVCQDAFLQVYNKLDGFEGRAAFKTWLYRIVMNLCLNRRKSSAARKRREIQAGQQYVEEVENAYKAFFAATPDDRVQETLNRMRDEDRQVIALRFGSDLSLAEMSDVMDLKLSATKMRLYRAMDEFKNIYTSLPTEQTTTTQ